MVGGADMRVGGGLHLLLLLTGLLATLNKPVCSFSGATTSCCVSHTSAPSQLRSCSAVQLLDCMCSGPPPLMSTEVSPPMLRGHALM